MTSGTVSKVAPSVVPLNLQMLKDLVESAASAKLAKLCCSGSHLVAPFFLKPRSSEQENQWVKSMIQLTVNRQRSDNTQIHSTVKPCLLVDNYLQRQKKTQAPPGK